VTVWTGGDPPAPNDFSFGGPFDKWKTTKRRLFDAGEALTALLSYAELGIDDGKVPHFVEELTPRPISGSLLASRCIDPSSGVVIVTVGLKPNRWKIWELEREAAGLK
jgi:hypothetical protein